MPIGIDGASYPSFVRGRLSMDAYSTRLHVPLNGGSVRPRSASSRSGTTLIEVMIVITILGVAAGVFSRMVIATTQLRAVNRENTIASSAARDVLEEMRDNPFHDIFALYNPDPSDDPDGAGSAPGNLFVVEGLRLLNTSETGFHLEVVLPTLPPGTDSLLGGTEWDRSGEDEPEEEAPSGGLGGKLGGLVGGGLSGGGATEEEEEEEEEGTTWELREDFQNAALGMPRDLNGDSMIDAADHAEDYILLPILIRVEWQGAHGPRVMELHSMLTEYIKS